MLKTPGQVLYHHYLKPRKLSQNALARAIGVPPRRINEIILGKRGISADTALRLGHYFGNEPEYWMQLQMQADLKLARIRLGDGLAGMESSHNGAKPRLKATATTRSPDAGSQVQARRRTAGRRLMR